MMPNWYEYFKNLVEHTLHFPGVNSWPNKCSSFVKWNDEVMCSEEQETIRFLDLKTYFQDFKDVNLFLKNYIKHN